MQTHLHLVKLVERKRLESEASAVPGGDGGGQQVDNDSDFDFDEAPEIDGPEAFLREFGE